MATALGRPFHRKKPRPMTGRNGQNCKLFKLLGGSVTGSTITVADIAVNPIALDLDVSITNNTFDLRNYPGGSTSGIWIPGSGLNLTFSGNTIRFGNTGLTVSCPVFKDMASADIVSCDNNTYYIGAAAVFAKSFDDGGGPSDYTFAQWQALGYDLNSTRLDPT